jgi:putative transposase
MEDFVMIFTQRRAYDSDLTDAEWERIRPLIPRHPPNGRLPRIPKREIVNAIFYLNKTGCQWRSLPHDFPCWSTVHSYYRRWRHQGVWETILAELRREIRVAEGKSPEPTAAIVDSQSVKTTEKGGRMDTMPARKSMVASVISW